MIHWLHQDQGHMQSFHNLFGSLGRGITPIGGNYPDIDLVSSLDVILARRCLTSFSPSLIQIRDFKSDQFLPNIFQTTFV